MAARRMDSDALYAIADRIGTHASDVVDSVRPGEVAAHVFQWAAREYTRSILLMVAADQLEFLQPFFRGDDSPPR